MNITGDILDRFDEVTAVVVNRRAVLSGEPAVEVEATLDDGRTITGTFASHPRSGFGGVEFSGPKNISALMISKIESVLGGTYERSN